jgi:hypothetical protein
MTNQQPIINPTPDNPDWADLATAPTEPASLLALAAAEPETMTGPALLDAIVTSEKALSYLAAQQMQLLTAFAQPFKAGDPTRLARQLARRTLITKDDDPDQVALLVPDAAQSLAQAEVAAALRIPSTTAGHRVQEAITMTGALTPTLHALRTGVLDRGKARVIAEHCAPLTPANTAKVQNLVLPGAGELNTSELRDVTGHAVITVDPDGAQERHHAAAARRELALHALPDAMATLKAYLPADGAVKIFQISDLLATGTAGTPGDGRGIGARRVDALIDIADQLLSNGYLDLTNYLGTELPDHGTPPTHTKPEPAPTNDDTADSAEADTNASTQDTSSGSSDATVDHTPVDDPAVDDTQVDNAAVADAAVDDTAVDDAAVVDAGLDDATAEDTAIDGPEINAAEAEPAAPASTATTGKSGKSGRSAEATKSGKSGDTGKTRNTARVFTRQGRRPHLSVTLGLGTLAGLDNLMRPAGASAMGGFGQQRPAGQHSDNLVLYETYREIVRPPVRR